MPCPRLAVSPFRHHKPRDLAFTFVEGWKIYLGRYGASESREKYARFFR